MAIATLAEVKEYLSIPVTNTAQDSRLQIILEASIAWINNRFSDYGLLIERDKTDRTELHDGGFVTGVSFFPHFRHQQQFHFDVPKDLPTDHIFLKRRPVASVTGLFESRAGKDQVFDSTTEILAEDFVVIPDQGLIRLLSGLRFDQGFQSIQVVYKAGFSPVPSDIKLAVLIAIDQFVSKTGTGSLKSERLGEYSYTLKDIESQEADIDFLIGPKIGHYLRHTVIVGA